jgi:hypothetical protein
LSNTSNAVVALEPRQLFATIAGTVFQDTDSSRVLTSSETPLAGQVVYLDANHNARLDKGETFTRTAENGTYRFDNLPTGTYDVAQVLPANYVQTSPSISGSYEGRFDILVRYRSKMTPAQQAAFQIAAARWQSIIVGDLPNMRTDLGNTDDVIIDASVVDIDGAGRTLGQASPTNFRDRSNLPSRGFMQFDSADLRALESEGRLNDVIVHEMGHVLGIGTIWDKQRRIKGSSTGNPSFIGPNAVSQYNQIFKKNALTTPIESNFGGGTRESHWPEAEFGTELMSGFTGTDNSLVLPLSRITVGQMQDLGYEVDYTHADAYDPTNTAKDKYWKPSDSGVLPYQKRIVLNRADLQNNINFGIRPNNRPRVLSFAITPSPAAKGELLTLSARAADRDGDRLIGVTFYRESNGIAGLQPGGDTYIASKLTSKKGLFSVTTATADLSAGGQTFYVSAVDSFQTAGRKAASVQIAGEITPPSAPTIGAVTRTQSTYTLNWSDNANNENGYRVQVGLRSDFVAGSILRSFNVPADSTQSVIDLANNGTLYFRVRAFNNAGSSAYARTGAIRLALPADGTNA